MGSLCDVSHDDAIFTDEKRDRCSEYSVLPGQFPTFLKDDGKCDSVFLRFSFVLLCVAASNHDDGQAVIAVLVVELYQLRSQLVARPTLWIGENQKHLSPAELLERNGFTMDAG